MAYELEIFKAGLWIGYFICAFALMFGVMVGYAILTYRYEKFIREQKLFQSYKDWEHKHKFRLGVKRLK